MERRSYVCDLCGVHQETTNHWFSVCITWEDTARGGVTLTLAELEAPRTVRADKLLHLCGERCVCRIVNAYLSATLAEILKPVVDVLAYSLPAEGSKS